MKLLSQIFCRPHLNTQKISQGINFSLFCEKGLNVIGISRQSSFVYSRSVFGGLQLRIEPKKIPIPRSVLWILPLSKGTEDIWRATEEYQF